MKKVDNGETFTYLNYKSCVKLLSKKFSSLTIADCGKSLLGKTIYSFVIGSGSKNILYVGGTHGLEWITSLLLLRFSGRLARAYENNECIRGFDVTDILKKKRLIIIPELNPDGIEIALMGAEGCGKYKNQNVEICKGDFNFYKTK